MISYDFYMILFVSLLGVCCQTVCNPTSTADVFAISPGEVTSGYNVLGNP